jgi:hypothetical protein
VSPVSGSRGTARAWVHAPAWIGPRLAPIQVARGRVRLMVPRTLSPNPGPGAGTGPPWPASTAPLGLGWRVGWSGLGPVVPGRSSEGSSRGSRKVRGSVLVGRPKNTAARNWASVPATPAARSSRAAWLIRWSAATVGAVGRSRPARAVVGRVLDHQLLHPRRQPRVQQRGLISDRVRLERVGVLRQTGEYERDTPGYGASAAQGGCVRAAE